jgi:HPt (histidine-containing phosphotransfer) domain-containing protein
MPMFDKPHPPHDPAQDPAGQGRAPAVLDPAAIERLQQLDPTGERGFLVQVLRTYEASLRRYVEAMVGARAVTQVMPVGETAHTLKSSSAAVGAMLLSAHCAEVERLARAGDAAALGEPLTRLLDEAARVRVAVRAMLPA